MASFPARMARLEPSRRSHVRFPCGAMLGEPGHAARQRPVVEAALGAAGAIAEPAGTVGLPYRAGRGRPVTEG